MSIVWIVLYGIVYTISEKASFALGTAHTITVVSVLLYIVALLLYLKQADKLQVYNVSMKLKKKGTRIVWMIPLLGISVLNCWTRFSSDKFGLSCQIILLLFFSVLLEEILFRGYLLTILHDKYGIEDQRYRMVIAGAIFGVFHLLNLFQGQGIVDTLVQVICAFLSGMCFCILTEQYQSIWPGLVIHFITNLSGNGLSVMSSGLSLLYVGVAFAQFVYIYLFVFLYKKS